MLPIVLSVCLQVKTPFLGIWCLNSLGIPNLKHDSEMSVPLLMKFHDYRMMKRENYC